MRASSGPSRQPYTAIVLHFVIRSPLDIIGHALRVRKIALCDRLALGAAELFHKPFRQPVPAVHTPVEFVDPFIKGISAGRHDGEQPDDPQAAVFDFTGPQADRHHARGERAAGFPHE